MRTFEAETMHEALFRIKQEMGDEAVIVKSRKVSRRSGAKLIELFEVTAALEHDSGLPASPAKAAVAPALPVAEPTRKGIAKPAAYDWRGNLPRVDEQGRSLSPAPAAATVPAPKVDGEKVQAKFMDMLRSEFRDVRESVEMPTRELRILTEEIRSALASAQSRDPLGFSGDSNAHAANEHLLQCGFEPSEAKRLLIAVLAHLPPEAQPGIIRQALRKHLLQEIRCTGGVRFVRNRATRIALVGPAGAGKTTSLLKLAAIAAIKAGRKVGLLAGDSIRLGAQAQLETFGHASDMPVIQVYGPDDLQKAQQQMAGCDLILLDTAGRPPQAGDADATRQLAMVQAFQPDDTLLTLSATTRTRELENQCKRFQPYRPSSVILTRIDECLELGVIHALARRTGMPLGYLCDGPVIPEHIQTAKAQHLAQLLLPEPSFSANLSPAGF